MGDGESQLREVRPSSLVARMMMTSVNSRCYDVRAVLLLMLTT